MPRVPQTKLLRFGIVSLLSWFMLGASVAAAPAYTPYANGVAGQSGVTTGPQNAVGGPDGTSASLLGAGNTLTLDMGAGEEGTNTLKVYFGTVNLAATIRVEFLDSGQAVLASTDQSLFFSSQATTQNFAFDWHTSGKAYRFVRLSNPAGLGFTVDSVEALGFIGSTPSQDTDGDGIPDRQDGNPLVFDKNTTSNNTANQTVSSGGGGTRGGAAGGSAAASGGQGSSAGPSGQVNNPPATDQDADGDQMPDAWETANGFNPKDAADAGQDADSDGLNNLKEYQLGANPRQSDTDGDQMPDGWEFVKGLNVLKNDAQEDPDGDYLTNRGEYHFGSNPYRADKVVLQPWYVRLWMVSGLCLAGGILALLAASIVSARRSSTPRSSKLYRLRHRLYRVFNPKD